MQKMPCVNSFSVLRFGLTSGELIMNTVTDFEAFFASPVFEAELFLAAIKCDDNPVDLSNFEDFMRKDCPYDFEEEGGVFRVTGRIEIFQELDEGHCDIEFNNIKWEKIA